MYFVRGGGWCEEARGKKRRGMKGGAMWLTEMRKLAGWPGEGGVAVIVLTRGMHVCSRYRLCVLRTEDTWQRASPARMTAALVPALPRL